MCGVTDVSSFICIKGASVGGWMIVKAILVLFFEACLNISMVT